MRLLVDAHLDLAWNAASFDRDLTLELDAMNQAEKSLADLPFRGKATTTFSEMRKGNVFLCIATLLARSGPQQQRPPVYKRSDLDFTYRIGAYAAAHAQLACYHLWEQQGHLRMIHTKQDFDNHLAEWKDAPHGEGAGSEKIPLGMILSMEGADPIVDPSQLPDWHAVGLRALGPAHYGHSHYAAGTATEGPITKAGTQLLKQMDKLNMGLDVTHLCDQSLEQAIDLFDGTVWASHHNCRALVPGDRQLPDNLIQKLIDRNAVIGTACDAWMLMQNWVRGETSAAEENITLETVANHIDHICQLAGNTNHAAIGTDLDGGFGTEQTPADLKSIADMQNLAEILNKRGYTDSNINQIFHQNWLDLLRNVLPE